MNNKTSSRIARNITILAAATALGGFAMASDGDWHGDGDHRSDGDRSAPVHFSGLINDYTPSAAVVKGGPYEIRGKWHLDVNERDGASRFTAEVNMATSDYGITQGSVNKDDPATRGAHTHHIILTDGVVSSDWLSYCPSFSPAPTGGFVVIGTAFVTGNGSPAPFGNPSPLTLCVVGGPNVKFANLTMAFGVPASKHFGAQAIHGVVARCSDRRGRESSDCEVVQ